MSVKIFITCSTCKQDRLVATNGMLKSTYEKKYPQCHKCGYNREICLKVGYQKGHVNWNKGLHYKNPKISIANKGKHYSPETEFKKGVIPWNYKGDKVGYHALHRWLDRNLEKKESCEFCGSTNRIQWASKNYSYTRNREDWLRLCQLCHSKYDRKNGWGLASQKFPYLQV